MTAKLDWYKREPAKFFGGTVGMRWEVKCTYSVVLDLIYDGGGSCPDDGPWIANMLGAGMSTRHWNAIKEELVTREKLVVRDGRIYNPAATRRLAREHAKTSSSPPERPFKTPGKKPDKIGENLVDLFAANGLTPKPAPETAITPARARENQSQSQTSSRLGKAEIIVMVEELAKVLNQDRGRYWEKDFERMIVDEGFEPIDILEAARAHRGGPIRGLNALRGLARKKRDDRLAGDEPMIQDDAPHDVTVEQWKEALVGLAYRGLWVATRLGPMPGTPGFRGPKDLEAAFLDGWRKQGSHPIEELDRNNYFVPYPSDDPDPERRARWSTIT